MLTFKPQRRQGDELNDEASLATATVIEGPDTARQEFKDETDINILMKRFGVGTLVSDPRRMTFSAIDYDLDLATAYSAIEEVSEAHSSLPVALREKYPTWQALLNAAESGNLSTTLQQMKESEDAAQRQAAVDAAIILEDGKEQTRRQRRAAAAAKRALEEDPRDDTVTK